MGMIHGEACYQPSLREEFVVERAMGERMCNGVPTREGALGRVPGGAG